MVGHRFIERGPANAHWAHPIRRSESAVNVERPIVEVRDLQPDEVPAAVRLLARGFRDEPLQIATLGPDPERRHQRLNVLFLTMFEVMEAQTPLGAFDGGTMVGVTGVAPPGTCQATRSQLLKYVWALLPIGPRSLLRSARLNASWAAVDPKEPHSHLGPLAVDADLRGGGIGSQILASYCQRLDDEKLTGYLETDAEAKVRLYQRFGFEVVGEKRVVGIPNWFMARRAR
jgi:ribosomal protein S18 acetylase RimI-like enzyme